MIGSVFFKECLKMSDVIHVIMLFLEQGMEENGRVFDIFRKEGIY